MIPLSYFFFHLIAIRSGDYYLFDNDEEIETEITSLTFPKTKEDKERIKVVSPIQVFIDMHVHQNLFVHGGLFFACRGVLNSNISDKKIA